LSHELTTLTQLCFLLALEVRILQIIAGPIAAQFGSRSVPFVLDENGPSDPETTTSIQQELVESMCLVMESVFDSWFHHPYKDESVPESEYANTMTMTLPKSQSNKVNNAASSIICAARGTAWSQLIKAFETVWSINASSNFTMMRQFMLLANLTPRYFEINEGGNTGTMGSNGDTVVPLNRPSLLMG
jgi:hypothetical protein